MDQRRVNVRAIIWHEGKLLAVRHKQKDGSEAPYWAIPGGGLDSYETLHAGVVREVMEETGVVASVDRLLFMQQFNSHRSNFSEELEFFYLIKNSHEFNNIDLASTSHGLEEITRIEFIDPSVENVLPAFLRTIDIASYVEQVLPVHLSTELTTPE